MKKFYTTMAILVLFVNLSGLLFLNDYSIDTASFVFVVNLIYAFVFLIFFFLLKKFQKTWLKILTIIVNICLLVSLSIIYLSVATVGELFNTTPETPEPDECYKKLMERTHYPEAISHFPRYVPDKYKNAYCYIENDFHGYDIHFLKFDADKSVVDDVIKYNKENIDKRYEFNGIDEYYNYLESNSLFGIENKKDYFIYIMKNPYKEINYVSGIIAPKENGTLVFFYANWNIKNTFIPREVYASFEEELEKNSNVSNIYTKDEAKKACAFAEKIKKIVDKEDFNAYADLMKYPLAIHILGGGSLTIASKEEFLKLDKKSIFNKNLKNKLKYKNMFANYQGFMLGNGDIWFEIDNNGICKIITLNIME